MMIKEKKAGAAARTSFLLRSFSFSWFVPHYTPNIAQQNYYQNILSPEPQLNYNMLKDLLLKKI